MRAASGEQPASSRMPERPTTSDSASRSSVSPHHLDTRLTRAGFVTRERRSDNRRVQPVVVTDAGEQLFLRLRRGAASFDGRLLAGLDAG